MPPTALRARGSSEVPFVFFISSPLTALGGVTLTALVGIVGWILLVWLAAQSLSHVSVDQPLEDNCRFIHTSLPGAALFIAALWRFVAATAHVCRWIGRRMARS